MTNTINTKEKELKTFQASQILKICGYTYADFSRSQGKTRNWFTSYLKRHKILEYRYYDELEDFVGEKNFKLAIDKLNRRIALKEERIKELSN